MKFSPPALEHRTHLPTPNTVLSMFPVSGVQKPSAIVHQSCSAKTRTHNFQINLIDQNPISKVGGARLGTEGGPWSAEALLPLCGVVEPCSTRTGRCRIPMRGAGTAIIRISQPRPHEASFVYHKKRKQGFRTPTERRSCLTKRNSTLISF